MPEPGVAPQPVFEGLAYGQNQAANQLADDADVDAEIFGEPEDEYTPTGDEEMLYGPTDRPDEPLTAGVGFGPGIDATRFAFQSDEDMLNTLAERIRAKPSTDPQAKAWAASRAKGL